LDGVARQANVRLAVVNPDRYLPSHQLIQQQLDAGKLGETVLVRSHRWEPVATNNRLGPSHCPGPLLRDLELALGLSGKPPNRVYALERAIDEPNAPLVRFIQAHLGFAGGGMALIDYANRLPPGDAYRSLTVIGSAGAAYADDHQNMQLLYRGGRPQAVPTRVGPRQLAALVQEFVDVLHTDRDTPGGVAAWRAAWTVAAAVSRSIETGQAIALGDD
jgi:predicted dehydrogenase